MSAELTVHLLDTRSLWPGDDISKAVREQPPLSTIPLPIALLTYQKASCLLDKFAFEDRKEVESCGDLREARAQAGKNGLQYTPPSRVVDTDNTRDCERGGIRSRGGDGPKSPSQSRPSRHTAHASGIAVVVAPFSKPSFSSTSSRPTRARTSSAPPPIESGPPPDVAIAFTKIPTLTALAEIECVDFAAYVDAHFSHLLTDEEFFDIVYTLGDGSCVKLLDGRVLSSQDIGRSDRLVEMGQLRTIALTHGARKREGGGGGMQEVVSLESDRVIETKLRRLYTFSVLKEALLNLLNDDSLRIGDVELHNVRAPEPGTVARCSVLGSWGELVAGGVEVWVRGLKKENVWLGVQGYEEDYLIGIAVTSNMEHSMNGGSWQSMEPVVKFKRVGIEEVSELFKPSGK